MYDCCLLGQTMKIFLEVEIVLAYRGGLHIPSGKIRKSHAVRRLGALSLGGQSERYSDLCSLSCL
jgi:hypothetical protein